MEGLSDQGRGMDRSDPVRAPGHVIPIGGEGELAQLPEGGSAVASLETPHHPKNGMRGWAAQYPSGFRETLKSTGRVLSFVTAPWWWPVGFLSKEIQKTPTRL